MFRGAALLIIANWLIALNVYGWNSYHVNYKLSTLNKLKNISNFNYTLNYDH